MAIFRSGGALQVVPRATVPLPPEVTGGRSSAALVQEGDPFAYMTMYATQPNVRTVVDFLARNVAQLGIHVFRRVSDTDRQRLTNHQLAQWLAHPTPFVT